MAQQPTHRYPLNGYGVQPCSTWNANSGASEGNKVVRALASSWAQGYLTAMDNLAMADRGAPDWLDGATLPQIERAMNGYCVAHPNDQIVMAVLAAGEAIQAAHHR
jgi:hypothetical protein